MVLKFVKILGSHGRWTNQIVRYKSRFEERCRVQKWKWSTICKILTKLDIIQIIEGEKVRILYNVICHNV